MSMMLGPLTGRESSEKKTLRFDRASLKRFGRVPCEEFKELATTFVEAFAFECPGNVTVEVDFYGSIPQYSTRLLMPDEMDAMREARDRRVFKRVASVDEIDEEFFNQAVYVKLNVRPRSRRTKGRLASAWGTMSVGGTKPRVINFYVQPRETFADTVWSALKNAEPVGWKYSFRDHDEDDGTTLTSTLNGIADLDMPGLDRSTGLLDRIFGITHRDRMMAKVVKSHGIKL